MRTPSSGDDATLPSDGLISPIATCAPDGVDVYAGKKRERTTKQAAQKTTLYGAPSFVLRGTKLSAALTSFSHRCLQLQARSEAATVLLVFFVQEMT